MDHKAAAAIVQDSTALRDEKRQKPAPGSNQTSVDETVNVIDDHGQKKEGSPDPPVILDPPPYSVYSRKEKRLIVASAAFSALFASWTAQIYLPALQIAADDLHSTVGKINLTVTSYMIFQGVTPIFVGGFADAAGRRPVYITCFVLYVAVDIALALTDSYGSLLGLRSVQSITISATQALCQGVVADISTSAERGQYAAFTALPTVLGPSIGPVIGGAIATYLGWRNIFWFLAIAGLTNLVIISSFFPETCRVIVGNGSILPKKANQSLLQRLRGRQQKRRHEETGSHETAIALGVPTETPKRGAGWTKFVSSLTLFFEKELSLLFFYSGLIFAGVFSVATAVPDLFTEIYGFDGLRIGLIYLPLAGGSVLAVVAVGKAMNWNFQRHAKKLGIEIDRSVQMDLSNFPVERARIEVAIPPLVLSMIVITSWGWAIEEKASIGIIVVLVFLLGMGLVSATSVFQALVADIRPGKAGAAAAANNIIKFLLAAGMTAAINPLLLATGPGKSYSIIAILYFVLSPCLYLVVRNGMKWRKEIRDKEQSGKA